MLAAFDSMNNGLEDQACALQIESLTFSVEWRNTYSGWIAEYDEAPTLQFFRPRDTQSVLVLALVPIIFGARNANNRHQNERIAKNAHEAIRLDRLGPQGYSEQHLSLFTGISSLDNAGSVRNDDRTRVAWLCLVGNVVFGAHA